MFAVINLGLKSIRLCLFDAECHLLYKKSHPLNTIIFGEGVEQDGEEWWSYTRQLFAKAAEVGHKLESIEAVTVSASASCLVCVDQKGRPLRPIIMVSDRRYYETEGASDEPVMIQRIRWLKKMEAETFEKSSGFLAPNDYLIKRLCGRAVTDPLNAEKSGYETARGDYAVEEGAIRSRLPEVAQVGEVVGTLLPGVAVELGLKAGTEVQLSTYDAIVSIVGSGVSELGELCDVSGTVTSIRMVSERDCSHPKGAVVSQPMSLFDRYYIGGSNNLGGGLIEWLKTTFYPASPHVYDMIQADAQSVSAKDSHMLFLPYLLGERAPIWNPHARGVFFGIERMHSRKHFARATIEAAAFAGRSLIEAITEAHGNPPSKIRLSGGLSRLEICNRIKADVYGMPIEIVSEFESTALGAHLLAFHRRLGIDLRSSEALKRTVKVRDIVLPDEDATATYQESYTMFKDIYAALEPLFLKHKERTIASIKSEEGYLENL